jgi:mono/diheme cytochrome c family protein
LSTRSLARLVAAAAAFVLLSGFTMPGCPWFKMMNYQQSRDGYSYDTDNYDAPGPKVPTMRMPVPGTVPIDGGDLPVTLLDADQLLKNPHPGDPKSIARGRALFGTFCSPCHGSQGHGDGPVGKLFPFVLSLTAAQAVHRSDPYIYTMIRDGRGLMPTYGARVRPSERWDIVNYVRSLQAASPLAAPAPAASAAPVPPATPKAPAAPATPGR